MFNNFKPIHSSVVIFAAIFIIGCSSEKYIAEIGSDKMAEKYTQNEFLQILSKHQGGKSVVDTISISGKEKFLDLYLKFRLKVLEAYDRGYNNDDDIKFELAEYKKNLSVTFLLDKEIISPALKVMYDRGLVDNRASHILIQIQNDDTLSAYKKTTAIIDSIQKGISFTELAGRNSQDPSVENNKGDLSYFSSGSMVREFEDEVYSLPINGVSRFPVRTQFGYHIVKVTDRIKAKGTLRVSHIMKRFSPDATAQDSSDAWEKFEAIADTIKNTKNSEREIIFSDMAKKYSDDSYSKDKGGDIGPVERRGTIPEFDRVIFSLEIDTPSVVFKTPFGYHIAMVTSVEPNKTFDEVKSDLQENYTTYFYPAALSKFLEKLKTKYNLTPGDSKLFHDLSSQTDTNATSSNADWDSSITKEVRAQTIFSIDGKKVSIDSVLSSSKTMAELQAISFKDENAYITIVNKVTDKFLLEYEAQKMENNYPEIKNVMKDYEEGALLFKVEQNDVWGKVKTDSASLFKHYDETKNNYTWTDRVNIQEIFVETDSIAQVVMNHLNGYTEIDTVLSKTKNKKTKKVDLISTKVEPISFDSAATLFNTRYDTKTQRGNYGFVPVKTNDLTTFAWTLEQDLKPHKLKFENGISIIRLLEKDGARIKTFAEAYPEVSSSFQEIETKRLAEELNEKLAMKFNKKINKEYFLEMNKK